MIMNLEKVMTIINQIEEQFPVDRWSINGLNLWPLLRIRMGFSLQYVEQNLYSSKQSLFTNFRQVLNGIFSDYRISYGNPSIDQNRVDFLFLSDTAYRRFQVDGKWYDTCFSMLGELCGCNGLKSLILQTASTHYYRQPTFEKTFNIEFDLEKQALKTIIENGFAFLGAPNTDWQQYERLRLYLKEQGAESCFIPFNQIRFRYCLLSGFEKYFRNILNKVQPRACLTICYYGLRQMAFILACKQLGIPVFDIQHGAQGEFHVAYGRWKNLPVNGYELLPDYFAVWSDREKRVIDRWADGFNHRPIIIGNLERLRYLDSEKIEFKKSFVKRYDYYDDYRYHVLLTLQPDYLLPDYMQEVINETTHIHWWVRLHPLMVKDCERFYSQWENMNLINVTCRELETIPLHGLLEMVDMHVTHSSSVVIDAGMHSIASIVTSTLGRELYGDIPKYANDKYTFVKMADEILQQGRKEAASDNISREHVLAILQNVLHTRGENNY